MSEICCHPPVVERGDSRSYRRVLWIVLGVNLAMFIVEMTWGLSAGSVSLQADSLDFLSDTVNYGISLFVAGMALRNRAIAAFGKGVTMGLFGMWCWHHPSVIGVARTGSAWPDVLVVAIMAVLAIQGSSRPMISCTTCPSTRCPTTGDRHSATGSRSPTRPAPASTTSAPPNRPARPGDRWFSAYPIRWRLKSKMKCAP